MKIIKETYTLKAEMLYVLSEEEYSYFKGLSSLEKIEYMRNKDQRNLSTEEIYPVGNSSKYTVVKNPSDDEKILASRMIEDF